METGPKSRLPSLRRADFSRLHLLVVVLAFATIGAIVGLTRSSASTPSNGLLGSDPNFFPITVWLQTPSSHATAFKNVGVNIFSGFTSSTLTTSNLSAVQSNGMGALIEDQSTALSSTFTSYQGVMKGWLQQDEPDNAQPDGNGGYGPCVDPSTIVNIYNQFKAADPTRPVILNLGQGVANINYTGRGSACHARTDMYPQYAQGADILSFDVYPINDGYPITYIADGVDNLLNWGGGKPVWAFIETTPQDSGNPKPTPDEIKAEVWLALTHGASGIQYFCHIFTPTFDEKGCLDDAAVSSAMSGIDSQIASLAPVLNSPTITGQASVSSASRIDYALKRYNGDTYLLTVSPNSTSASATFSISGLGNQTVSVIDESRTLTMSGGSFQDGFGAYGVHLYQLAATAKTGDLNGDSSVNISDLSILLSNWNATSGAADINGDGKVDVFDLSILLSHFGS